MTTALEEALAEVAKLPPEEQDVLATLLLDEIRSEQRWSATFAQTQDGLRSLAAEALAEHKRQAAQIEPMPCVPRQPEPSRRQRSRRSLPKQEH